VPYLVDAGAEDVVAPLVPLESKDGPLVLTQRVVQSTCHTTNHGRHNMDKFTTRTITQGIIKTIRKCFTHN
jgi:hypothetical protein